MKITDSNLDPKIKERCDALYKMGLLWNGEAYVLEDINVHWLDITTFTDEMFGGLCGMIRARIATDLSDRVTFMEKANEIKTAGDDISPELRVITMVPNQLPSVVDFASGLLRSLENGEINPLDLKLQFKALAEIEDMVKPRLNELALAEAGNYGKGFEYKGATMKVQEMGTRYDYSNTGDLVYQRLMEEKAELDKKIKAREELAKTIHGEALPCIDPKTGEIMEVYPPVKKSTTTLVISLK